MELQFKKGLHPSHEMDDPQERAANLRWFEQMWAISPIGTIVVTDFCKYERTATGFRRILPAAILIDAVNRTVGDLAGFSKMQVTKNELREMIKRAAESHLEKPDKGWPSLIRNLGDMIEDAPDSDPERTPIK
jgi:hypothetical protein